MAILQTLFISIALALACPLTVISNIFSPKPVSPFKAYNQMMLGSALEGFYNISQELPPTPLAVEGVIPAWLQGTLLRNGPAKFYTTKNHISHWFDGLAMIHAFSLENGKLTYTNKFLQSDAYQQAQKNDSLNLTNNFATDPCKTLFQRITSLFIPHKKTEILNANVNIAQYAQAFVALTESPLPVAFDPITLNTIGSFIYDDSLPKSDVWESAHPHFDSKTNEHINYFIQYGRISTYNFYTIAKGSKSRSVIASIPTKEPAYMHSFSVTKNYIIFTEIPLVVNPINFLVRNRAFIKNFVWKPELGTRWTILNRHTGTIEATYQTDPFFMFHHVNAYESDDNRLIIDIVTYPDARILELSQFDHIFNIAINHPIDTHDQTPYLSRFTINCTTRQITADQISPECIEMPRINQAHQQKPYRYAYGVSSYKSYIPYAPDSLVKIDTDTKTSLLWYEQGCYPGEPIFIAQPGSIKEDDGVLTSVVLDTQRHISFLLVLDAHTFQEIARAYVPHIIPFGIHGSFYNKIS